MGQGLRDWPHWLKLPDQRSNVGVERPGRRSIPPRSTAKELVEETENLQSHLLKPVSPGRAFNSVERQLPRKHTAWDGWIVLLQ